MFWTIALIVFILIVGYLTYRNYKEPDVEPRFKENTFPDTSHVPIERIQGQILPSPTTYETPLPSLEEDYLMHDEDDDLSFYLDDDDDEGDEDEKWIRIDFPWGPKHRKGDVVALPDLTDISLAGVNQPGCHGFDFVRRADPVVADLRLDRTFNEETGRLEIAAMARVNQQSARMLIGYIPAVIADEIYQTYSPDMPMHAEIRRIGVLTGQDICFIAINILGPPSPKRKRFLLD